ncbi:hypothetical protein K8T06_08535, partial [bacterium]|nr:hypothetical protein [bacterium]
MVNFRCYRVFLSAVFIFGSVLVLSPAGLSGTIPGIDGNQFARTYGETGIEEMVHLSPSWDGGFVAGGTTNSLGAGGDDFLIVKYDSTGEVEWIRTIGGPGTEKCNSITQSSGSILAVGYTTSYGAGLEDVLVANLDQFGTIQWVKAFGGSSTDIGIASAYTFTYFIGGFTDSFGSGSTDCLLFETSYNGSLDWSRTVGGAGNDRCMGVASGYYFVGESDSFGSTGSDFLFGRIDGLGNLDFATTAGGAGNDSCTAVSNGFGSGWVAGG